MQQQQRGHHHIRSPAIDVAVGAPRHNITLSHVVVGGAGFAVSRTNLHHSPNADKLVGQFVTLHELAGPLVLKRQ